MTTAASTSATNKCQHCGLVHVHAGVCHLIKAIEYFENGAVKRVEYKIPADFMLPPPPTLANPHPAGPMNPWWSRGFGGNTWGGGSRTFGVMPYGDTQ